MSGQFLRRGTPPSERHECPLPEEAYRGDVWACDCGRRWKCVLNYRRIDGEANPFPESLIFKARWEPRYWPWPRRKS